ncbi:MAG: xanthine dehydrogenase family protein subunit M [Candidatus Caldarchaeum sp.]
MNAFAWVEPKSLEEASAQLRQGGVLLAGGIDLLTLLKERLMEPPTVINLKSVKGLKEIQKGPPLRVGALVTLREIAEHEEIRKNYTALAESALSVASPQIRNVGTLGGNLCQRPRCWYFRHEEINCLKKGGVACFAVAGNNEYHAIFGGGPCHIVHPSDLAPALIALNATVVTNKRRMNLEQFFVLPKDNVKAENVLERDEIVTLVEIPRESSGMRSAYVKVRERPSFDWALVGCAVALRLSENGTVFDARVVISGVAPIPWRSTEAENVLKGKRITDRLIEETGSAAVQKATPMTHNAYKVRLTANTVRWAVAKAVGERSGTA